MAQKLGEYLVRGGKLTEDQLSTVLERQVTMGGRIGTNLIELGYLTEEELTRFLSEKLNAPRLDPALLDSVSEKVISLVPKEVAEKYQAAPFHVDQKTLHVAMADPTDLEGVDELSFLTGLSVKSYLTTEARIQLALERYYNVNRRLRYISILDEERQRVRRLSPRRNEKREPTSEEFEQFMSYAKDDFVHAKGRDEIFAVLIKNLCLILDRAILFGIKGGQVTILMSLPRPEVETESDLEAPLVELPLFREVIRKGLFYQGEADSSPTFTSLLEPVGGGRAKEIILLPLILMDKTMGLVYGDNYPGGRSISNVPILKKLISKGAMALEILVLKKKILEL